MKGKGWTQGKGFSYVMAVPMAALVIVAATNVYDYRSHWVKKAHANARTEAYVAEHAGPFCAFEGVWYDWEDDETITLGCLEVKGNVRSGSYSSAMGASSDLEFLDERHL
jgi:hypothetical protein